MKYLERRNKQREARRRRQEERQARWQERREKRTAQRKFKQKTTSQPRGNSARDFHRAPFHQPTEQEVNEVYAKIGYIVERVNFIELRINRLIAEFYVEPHKQTAFLEDFMFAGRLRLNDKIKIFRKILARKDIPFDEASFEKWIHIRNMLAHGSPSFGIDERAILHFNGNIYDIENEFRDFEKLQAQMVALIQRACDNCEKQV